VWGAGAFVVRLISTRLLCVGVRVVVVVEVRVVVVDGGERKKGGVGGGEGVLLAVRGLSRFTCCNCWRILVQSNYASPTPLDST
jgi:hypothetical protein